MRAITGCLLLCVLVGCRANPSEKQATAAVLPSAVKPAPSPVAPAAKPERWEYAAVTAARLSAAGRDSYLTNVFAPGEPVASSEDIGTPIHWTAGIDHADDKTLPKTLAAMGRKGWELVSVIQQDRAEGSRAVYYFRRPLTH